jgi:hypothetical protein
MVTTFQLLLIGGGCICLILGFYRSFGNIVRASIRSLLGLTEPSTATGGQGTIDRQTRRISNHQTEISQAGSRKPPEDRSTKRTAVSGSSPSGESSQHEESRLGPHEWYRFAVHREDYISDPFDSHRMLYTTPDEDPFKSQADGGHISPDSTQAPDTSFEEPPARSDGAGPQSQKPARKTKSSNSTTDGQ